MPWRAAITGQLRLRERAVKSSILMEFVRAVWSGSASRGDGGRGIAQRATRTRNIRNTQSAGLINEA